MTTLASRELWDASADRYAHERDALQHAAARAFVDALAPAPGTRAIDVGCGPGHVASALAARGVRARGVDISPRMVALARALHPGIPFDVADAGALPCEDASVDLVTFAFVLDLVPDPAQVLHEAMRALAPGGRVAVLAWDPTSASALSAPFHVLGQAGLLPGPPEPPSAPLRAARLRDVQETRFAIDVPMADPDAPWRILMASPFAALVSSLDASLLARVRAASVCDAPSVRVGLVCATAARA